MVFLVSCFVRSLRGDNARRSPMRQQQHEWNSAEVFQSDEACPDYERVGWNWRDRQGARGVDWAIVQGARIELAPHPYRA